MRHFLLYFLCLFCLHIAAKAQQNSLPETISVEISDKTLEEVIELLHEKYRINFYYSPNQIPLQNHITIVFRSTPFFQAMDELCSMVEINYQINSDQIVLYKKVRTVPTGNISGYVMDSLTGERLIGATIIIEGTAFGTTTNAYGYFSYSLNPAKYTLRCSYIGYKSRSSVIEVTGNTVTSFSLLPSVMEIDAVKLESDQLNRSVNLDAGTDIAPASIMRTYPAMLSESDVLQFIKMMPGVQTTTEGLNGLFVRGGMPQHTSFIIDDAPMYNMFHFSGWFSTINPDAVKEVRLYKSHLPGKSSGSLASVVDIRLRDGNNQNYNASGSIGTITSRITLEGPLVKSKSSFIISARRTYLDQIIRMFRLEGLIDMGKIYFYDINAKANYTLNRNNRFYLSSYSGKDLIDDNGGVEWGNSFVSARWNHLFSDRIFSNLCLSGSWYRHCFDTDVSEDETSQLTIQIKNYNAKYDVTWYTPKNNKVSFGVNFRYNRLPPVNISGKALNAELIDQDLRTYHQTLYGAYLHGELNVTSKLGADIGIKFNVASRNYPSDTRTYAQPEPILGLEYKFNKEVSFKTAYSRNYQYYHGISVFELLLPFDKYMLAGSKLKPQFADHISAGFFYSPSENRLELSFEPYWSYYQNQYRIPINNDIFFAREIDFNPESGNIKTYGMEVSFRKLSGRFTGIMSYTLSKTQRKESEVNLGNYYNAYYDRRHDLVLSLNFQVAKQITLSSNWVYMSGNPYSLPVGKYELRGRSVPLYDSQNLYNQRMPDYHRLDINARLGLGKKLPVRHYLSVMFYNVYARRNPVFYNYTDVADGNLEKNPNSDFSHRVFSMTGYYFFNFFPSISYEYKFGK